MRRSSVAFLAVALLAGVLYAATKPCSTTVRNALASALQNEREAGARYQVYAEKAATDGHDAVAALFRAAAYAEKVHARRFEKAMKERGIEVPPAPEFAITAGETPANIRAASSAESGERDGSYREAVRTCQEAGDKEIGLLFDQTRDVEADHVNLFNQASRLLSGKEKKTFYVCDHCGYTADFTMSLCAICRVRESPHAVE